MRTLPFAFLLAASLVPAGCGGSGGGGGGGSPGVAAAPVTLTVRSTPALDGFAFAQGTVRYTSNVVMGDYANTAGPQGGLRGFVSFDIFSIPPGATVLAATLTLVQHEVQKDPYATLGSIVLDQVVYGAQLDGGAYDRSFPTFQGFATLSSDATLGPKTADVTAQVQADIALLRLRSQFRLRFTIENDLDADLDQAIFWSANTGLLPDQRPTLVVTYQP